MGYHVVNLLRLTVDLDSLSVLFVAAGAGFLLFVVPLHGVLLGLFLEKFSLTHKVPRDMHQSCSCTGRMITQIACMNLIALSREALLEVGWRGGFSFLIFPAMTGMLDFCPVGIFRIVTTFVNLLRNFHVFNHFACILVGPSLKIPSL